MEVTQLEKRKYNVVIFRKGDVLPRYMIFYSVGKESDSVSSFLYLDTSTYRGLSARL